MVKQGRLVENMWNIFQKKLQKSIKNNIPHKAARNKDECSLLDTNMKQLMRKRDSPADAAKYKTK